MKLTFEQLEGRIWHLPVKLEVLAEWNLGVCDVPAHIEMITEEYEVNPDFLVRDCPGCGVAYPANEWDGIICPCCDVSVEDSFVEGDYIEKCDLEWFKRAHQVWELFYDSNPDDNEEAVA